MAGKVTGVSSEELNRLNRQKAKLREDARNAVIDHYSAPDGDAGNAQRENADKVVQDASSQEQKVTQRIRGIEEIKVEAMRSKDDLSRWLKMTD